MMVGFAARGAGHETNGLAQSALSKEGACPLLVEEKQAFAPPSFPTNSNPYKPQGGAVVQMSPDGEGQRLSGPVPIGRDQAKSRWVQ